MRDRREKVTTMDKPETPNLDRMLAVREESNKISAFLDWLIHNRQPPLYICAEDELFEDEVEECPTCGAEPSRWAIDAVYARRVVVGGISSINKLLAEYYEIDYDEMERERQGLLEWVREEQEEQCRTTE